MTCPGFCASNSLNDWTDIPSKYWMAGLTILLPVLFENCIYIWRMDILENGFERNVGLAVNNNVNMDFEEMTNKGETLFCGATIFCCIVYTISPTRGKMRNTQHLHQPLEKLLTPLQVKRCKL